MQTAKKTTRQITILVASQKSSKNIKNINKKIKKKNQTCNMMSVVISISNEDKENEER